jgi:hypothetical protein
MASRDLDTSDRRGVPTSPKTCQRTTPAGCGGPRPRGTADASLGGRPRAAGEPSPSLVRASRPISRGERSDGHRDPVAQDAGRACRPVDDAGSQAHPRTCDVVRTPIVTVCRGCCCGVPGKSPGVEHDARLGRLEAALEGLARIRLSECLGPCERADVVAVSPTRAGRAAGGRPAWLARTTGRVEATAVADWLRAGGPGVAPLPPALGRSRIRPPADGR